MEYPFTVTYDINESFCRVQYGNLKLIMFKENGYINATDLCALENKYFTDWLLLKSSRELVQKLESMNYIRKSNYNTRFRRRAIIEVKYRGDVARSFSDKNRADASKQSTIHYISGHYVHRYLVPHIASWASASFAINMSNIVNVYISGKYDILQPDISYPNKLSEKITSCYLKYTKNIENIKQLYNEQCNNIRKLDEMHSRFTKDAMSLCGTTNNISNPDTIIHMLQKYRFNKPERLTSGKPLHSGTGKLFIKHYH